MSASNRWTKLLRKLILVLESIPDIDGAPNPQPATGLFLSFIHEIARCLLVAQQHDDGGLFLRNPLDGGPGASSSFSEVTDCLCCTLGGFSKSLGLPQLKLSWIVVSGPDRLIEPVLDGLDYVADTYLSVSTPVALAASALMTGAAPARNPGRRPRRGGRR